MMKKNWINFILASGLSMAMAAPAFADEPKNAYYKYKDKDGHTIISSTLPPDVANQGYQIISPMGNVIKTISPRKTNEEISKDAIAEQKEADRQREAEKAKQAAEVQAHKDEILLQSFSSEADIERARNDKIASISVLEEIIRENMTGLEKQLKDANAAMLNYQHTGQKPPESLQKTINESERQIKDNQAFLTRKEAEKKEIYSKYKDLTERFKALQAKKGHTHEGKTPTGEPSETPQTPTVGPSTPPPPPMTQ